MTAAMLNLISILVGIIALPLMLIALIPFLGWLNYMVIPVAVVGIALGALSDSNTGRNLNIVVAIVGIVRLHPCSREALSASQIHSEQLPHPLHAGTTPGFIDPHRALSMRKTKRRHPFGSEWKALERHRGPQSKLWSCIRD